MHVVRVTRVGKKSYKGCLCGWLRQYLENLFSNASDVDGMCNVCIIQIARAGNSPQGDPLWATVARFLFLSLVLTATQWYTNTQ